MLRGPRPNWARWAARLACVFGGLFFWFLLSGTAHADPAPAPNTLGSLVDSVVSVVTTPPATGIQPVDDLTSTVAGLLRPAESAPPAPLRARSELPTAPPEQIPAPVVEAPAPAPPPSVAIHAPQAHRPFNVDSTAAAAPPAIPSTDHRVVTPPLPAAPAPAAPSAASSSGTQPAFIQPPGTPPVGSHRLARLLPRDDDFTDIRVTRPEVSPD